MSAAVIVAYLVLGGRAEDRRAVRVPEQPADRARSAATR